MKTSIAILIVLSAALIAWGQDTSGGQPANGGTGRPTVKRRSFDQFDLPGGLVLPKPVESPDRSADPLPAAEFVDQETYYGVLKMIEYAANVEKEYRATASIRHDPREYYSADNVLKRKSKALFNIIELYRTGLFGSHLKSGQNRKLLEENQRIIGDIQAVYSLVAADKARLRVLAERYLPTKAKATETELEQSAILGAMLARLNENFALLKAGVVLIG